MGSNRTGEVNCKIYAEDREILTKTNSHSMHVERNEKDFTPSKCRQSSQTPEYVKRTAKLFESVTVTENNNDMEKKQSIEYVESSKKEEKRKPEERGEGHMKISLDSLDGEFSKKPSYLGVSCSNSGYRNVINYNSKLREGFWTANCQRESLVLNSSRLRESSPMRRDFEFLSHNGNSFRHSANLYADKEREKKVPVNGSSETDKFVNISTSTKTISTFRNSKDIKANDLENNVNGFKNHVANSGDESRVNLKQILNGKPEDTSRRGYSSLGFSPKILKSPEKNCNSFLKNISSFENNCKKSQTVKNSSYSKMEQTNLTNSIQQRIERLYGPGALAHGFYSQKSNLKENEKISENISSVGAGKSALQPTKLQNGSAKSIDLNPVVNSSKPTPEPESIAAAKTNGHGVKEKAGMKTDECEKNGVYFLKLLKRETDRLERLASFAEKELENGENLNEEISGKLRAAAGKARLLMSQKLHQFEGLCQKNMNEKPSDAFPTTSEDLAGFWDMVMLQIVQVYGVFEELEELKKNNWKGSPVKKEGGGVTASNGESKPVKISPAKKAIPLNGSLSEKQSQKSEAAKKAREEGRRKLLEERRKKMKEQKQNKTANNENEVEIFAK